MVRVTWNPHTGELITLESADGPGAHTDDVPTESIKSILSKKNITEDIIATTIMKAYDGKLSKFDCHVTLDSFIDPNIDIEGSKTTIAFVEIEHEEDKLLLSNCDSCGTSLSKDTDDIRFRRSGDWMYRDIICETCGDIGQTELVEHPN